MKSFISFYILKILSVSHTLVAHAYNPSYLEGLDQEDLSLRLAQGNSS
jgi:hypothetical protein